MTEKFDDVGIPIIIWNKGKKEWETIYMPKMTEKRYIKENFYDEYAIKKEDTIIAIVDSGTNARKICNELNTLYEENEQLKQQCKDFMEMLDDMCIAYLVNDGLEEILNE